MAGETLKITGGNAAGQDITLEQELVIGRSTPGLGSLGGDSEISRVHARVFHDPSGRLVVEDLGSTNGTFVNGNRISGQQTLNAGDELRVGQTTMSVEGGAAGATTVGNVVPAPVPAPAPPVAPSPQPPTQALPPQQQGFGQAPPPPPYGGGPTGGPPQRAGGGPSRNLLIALGAALVVILVVAGLAIGGVFSGSDSKSKTTAQTTPTTPTVAMPQTPTETTPSQSPGGNGYSSTFKNSFVSSCAKSGSLSTSQCRCIINKAEAQYSLPEFISAVGEAQKGTTPPKLKQIFVSCANA